MTAKVSKKNSFSTLSYQVLWLGSGIRLPRTIPLGPKEFKNRWTVAGDEKRTDIPVIADLRTYENDNYLSYAYNAYNLSTARVAKGDFIRMKEMSLAYDFPAKWVKAIRLSDISMKLQATNLFLIYADKKLNGQDPEFYNAGGVASPMPKQFTLTVRLGI